MSRGFDLIVENGGLGRLAVAWRALKAGRSVLLAGNAGEAGGHLLPGFASVNLRALELALIGTDSPALPAVPAQSLLQIVTPSVRFQWWSDARRRDKELVRAAKHQPFPADVSRVLADATSYEEALFRQGRLAPQGFFRSRLSRRSKIAAPSGTVRLQENSPSARFWELTAAGLSGGDLPEAAAIAAHGSLAGEGRWATGPSAAAIRTALLKAVTEAGAETVKGAVTAIEPRGKGWVAEAGGSSYETPAVVLGQSEPKGFPQNRKLAGELLPCASVSFVAKSSGLDPSLGPRTIWHRSENPGGEGGPRVVWIAREPVSDTDERIVTGFRGLPGADPGHHAGDTHELMGRLLSLLSPGFDRLASDERYELNRREAAWLPLEIPYLENPRLAPGLFRLDRSYMGGYGSTAELAMARDIARWLEKPLPRASRG